MIIDINDCDLNNDYYHFTNVCNIQSIINTGLKPSVGAASKMVVDRPNVSCSKGGKGIMGIINSFIYMFSIMSISHIPNEFKKYFMDDITDFTSDALVGLDISCRAMTRKLKDEVYFNVQLDETTLKNAKIGGLTGFDINLSTIIDKTKLRLVTSNGEIITAYDFLKIIYEKVKNKQIFRDMNEDLFYMLETENSVLEDNKGRNRYL